MAERFEPGETKAWCVSWYRGCFWTSHADDIVGECENYDEGKSPFTEDQITAMNPGDTLATEEWTVECRMVDQGWLDSLPEFDGW